MPTEKLTLTQADVDGFQRVCRYLWRSGAGLYVDVEDVDDRSMVHTHHWSSARRGSVSCTALVGASIDLELPDSV